MIPLEKLETLSAPKLNQKSSESHMPRAEGGFFILKFAQLDSPGRG